MVEWSRRDVLRVSLLGSASALAGCGSGADPSGKTTARTTIPNATATDRALTAETDYVRSRLENATCLQSWGIGEYTMDATATVIARGSEGVRVEVQRPYSYSTDDSIVDTATHATYLVGETETQRLSGERVDPC